MNNQQVKKYLLIAGFLAAVFLPRVLDLGHILTIDEPLWLSRGQSFINALSVGNFEKTVIGGQPGVTTTWLVGLSSPWQSLFAGQLSIALATGVLILISTYFFRILLGNTWGTITGLFIALDPFLLAHSRVAHTDALLALFYISSIAGLLCALLSKTPIRRYVVMSAALASGAILTKIFGLILVPTAIVSIVAILWYKKEHWTQMVRTIGLWVSVCILTTFIAWPALWSHSDVVADLLFSRAAAHGEGTRVEETTSASWYYLREIFFRLSVPVTILLPFGVWQLRKNRTATHSATALTIILSGLALVLVLNLGSDKSDRYILFTYLSIIVTAVLGLRGIVEALDRNKNLKKWTIVAMCLPVIYLVADDIRLFPYYLAHYNRLYPIESDHKLGWGEGLEQGAAWIQENHPGAKVYAYYPRVFEYFYPQNTDTITHINDDKDGYVVLYRSMLERGTDSAESDILNEFLYNKNKKPEHVIYINGLPYVWIFSL